MVVVGRIVGRGEEAAGGAEASAAAVGQRLVRGDEAAAAHRLVALELDQHPIARRRHDDGVVLTVAQLRQQRRRLVRAAVDLTSRNPTKESDPVVLWFQSVADLPRT